MTITIEKIERPLVIASSGGGGHIAAAKGVIEDLKKKSTVDVITHRGTFEKQTQLKLPLFFVESALYTKCSEQISTSWKWLCNQIGFDPEAYYSLCNEIKLLKDSNYHTNERQYLDLLLDLHFYGYEMAGMFNFLQRHDKTDQLLTMVKKQSINNYIHYSKIKSHFMDLLKKQAEIGKPYTTIISTQPQALEALCDAVSWYNESYLPKHHQLKKKYEKLTHAISEIEKILSEKPTTYFQWFNQLYLQFVTLWFLKRALRSPEFDKFQHDVSLKPLRVHQYMTDLPTSGAIHFLSPLKSLNKKQRKLIDVYCEGEPDKIFKELVELNIHSLKPDENPMLRSAFRDKSALSFYTMDHPVSLRYQNNQTEVSRTIARKDKVASIMLGALGGNASKEYLLPLLESGYQHIFVFGAKDNEAIMNMIAALPKQQRKAIIPLGRQNDQAIAPIMTRSNCVITRSGGLSTMEQMALPLIKNKLVLIHHTNPGSEKKSLTSGLPWEDGNADTLIKYINDQGAKAYKVCPDNIRNKLLSLNKPASLSRHTHFYKHADYYWNVKSSRNLPTCAIMPH